MLWDREYAHFGSHDDMIVIGDQIPRWTQTITIQSRTNLSAISKGNGSRAIPRLHQC